MPDFSAINEVSWTDPRVLFLLGLILAGLLGALVFLALHLERRRLRSASRQEDAERLGRAFEGTGLGFWDWDIANGVFSYDEEWFTAHLGYKEPDRELGLDFVGAIIHPDDLAVKNDALYRHLIGETDSYAAEFRLRKKDGSWVWILSRGKVFERGRQGQALRFAGADSVIDQQKTAEMVLEIEKEVAVRFGEVYTEEGTLQALAEGIVRLPGFEFAAVFQCKRESAPMERIFSRNLPEALDGIDTLRREVGRERIYFYDESDLVGRREGLEPEPLTVTEIRLVRNGAVAGCVWVGSRGRAIAPGVVLEAMEQLEIQAQGALDRIESENYFRAGQRNLNTLINSIDEIIFILDEDYGVVYANDVVVSELGFDREELVGKCLLELVPAENRDLARENFADLAAGDLPLASAQFLKKGRGLMQAEVQISTGRWGESDALFCVVRNAGRRDEATRALERRDQRLRIASRALVELITAPDMENGIREAVGLVASVFEADRICVSERVGRDEAGEGVDTRQISCWKRDDIASVSLDGSDSERGRIDLAEWADDLREGRSVSVVRDDCTGAVARFMEERELRSLLLVPIRLRDVWWGVMGAELREEAREWTAGDVSLLEIVGSGLAGLVETVRLQRDLIEAKNETEKTNRELGVAIRHAEEMADEASRANRSKTEFLANMSHEIRTPMNAILGFSELIEAEIEDPALLEFLGAIRSSGKTLLSLINDLLDLSKIEAGKMSLQYEPVALRELVQDMANIFQVRCDEKGIGLQVRIDRGLPGRLMLDESRIRQIIFNLVGNAVKFTHRGGVEIAVFVRRQSDAPHKVALRIEVVDSGIGIAKEDQKTIFEPFEQSRGQKQQVYGGTGLGLSITSRLVKMMGGTLSLSSAPDRGSTFVVDLPGISSIESADPSADAARGPSDRQRGFNGARVLVVDDNALNRRVLAASLRSRGMDVREAASGSECLERAADFQSDLVFMDLLMPDLSGEETTLRLRKVEGYADVPVVACTALDLSRARDIAERAGCCDILVKPIAQNSLSGVLERHLPVSAAVETPEPATEPAPAAAAQERGEPERLAELVATLEREFVPEWSGLRKRFQIAPILKVAGEMRELAESHGSAELREYAEELRHSIGLFDVEKLREGMDRFPGVLDRLKRGLSEEVAP